MTRERTITTLLAEIVADFPRKRDELAKLVPPGEPYMDLVTDPPLPISRLPTFDPKVTRPLSPMLRARFRFASNITRFGELWLGPQEMAKWPRKPGVLSVHESRR